MPSRPSRSGRGTRATCQWTFAASSPSWGYAATATIRARGGETHGDQTALYRHVRDVPGPRAKNKAGAGSSAGTSSRLGRTAHEILRPSAFDGARGHARDEVVDEEGIQHSDGDRAQKCSGHQLAPEELVTVDELLRNADWDGLDQAVIQEDQRVEEFVP